MSANFELATKEVEAFFTAKGKTSDDNKLALYALYKQATVGNNTTDKPGTFDFKGKAKWEAWNKKKDVSSDQAKTDYVALAKSILPADAAARL